METVHIKFLGWRRVLLSVSMAVFGVILTGCVWLIPAACISISLETAIGLLRFILYGACMAGGWMIGLIVSDKCPVWEHDCTGDVEYQAERNDNG